MKILFAYFDFTAQSEISTIPRGLGECALNLSTTHRYTIKKTNEHDCQNNCTYIVSRSELKEGCIPEGFWGERIYNVTAIVGVNGSGKSTIIHNMIKAVVYGLKPRVPFLLVVQKTDSEELYLYCGNGCFCWKGSENLRCELEYPDELKSTKTMLLDNTLSFSAIELNKLYEDFISKDYIIERKTFPDPIPDNIKQFCNKSLLASIRYSTEISMAGRTREYQPVSGMIASHFRYESYQETRFLFDRYKQKNIDVLRDESFSVPVPKCLFVDVLPIEWLYEVHLERDKKIKDLNFATTAKVCNYLQKFGFIGKIFADALLNLYIDAVGTIAGQAFVSSFDEAYESIQSGKPSENANPEDEVANVILKKVEYYGQVRSWCPDYLREHVKYSQQFVAFVSSNRQTLLRIFAQTASSGFGEESYIIDIRKTVSDSERRLCMVTFLELYRKVSTPDYFLVFSSGMSSGEKNFLRMLTQFRYLLHGHSVYPDDAKDENTGEFLLNSFPKNDNRICDTLFLFLDEADLTYHPEWQRIFISKLTSILPRMFRNPYNLGDNDLSGCKDIQVILATHSPLMLGDFPKACVNYLNWNSQSLEENKFAKRRSTFGENLYTILKDSFFMNYTVGEFARVKIDNVVKWCTLIHNDNDESNISGTGHDKKKEFWNHYRTVQLLPPGIIQAKLIAELEDCGEKIGISLHENESEIDRMVRHNKELQKKLDQANDKLRKAGLLSEQDS